MSVARSYLKAGLLLLAALTTGYFLLRRPAEGSLPHTVTLATTARPVSQASPQQRAIERELEIVTLLPRDAIPAIDNPRFYSAAEADAEYEPTELVLGVSLNGESRAYSSSHLNRHEIVNDTVGGSKIAVTW